jgi:preprotein translocase subunit SecE
VANKEVVKAKNSEVIEDQNSYANTGFLADTRQELAKVVWPSRQQLLSESAAVMLMVTLVATTVYLVDNVFGWLAGKVF